MAMKFFKSVIIIICLIMCCFLLSSCEADNKSYTKDKCKIVIDNIIANKQSATQKALSGIYPDNNMAFSKKFKEYRALLEGVTTYKLTRTSSDMEIRYYQEYIPFNKFEYKPYYVYMETFTMTTNTKSYQIAAGYVRFSDTKDSLVSFEIAVLNSKGGSKSFTGTIENMHNASVVQWMFFVMAILETLFVIVLLIDCYDHNFPKKTLWMLLILLGMVSRNIFIQDGIFLYIPSISHILSHTAYITHESDLIHIRILVPIGAIIYLIMRKKLL